MSSTGDDVNISCHATNMEIDNTEAMHKDQIK
jgi:hypothetical protein